MPFWGSSKSSSNDDLSPKADGSSTDFAPETPSLAPTETISPFGGKPSNAKQALMQQVQEEAAIANAKALVSAINQNCYERCVPKPGSSLSGGEEKCYTMCMEKYMNAWNVVSRAYVQRLNTESQHRGQGFGGS